MILIPLGSITANPWQPRQGVDPAHIRALADDIAVRLASRRETCGLLQLPAGRLVDKAGLQLLDTLQLPKALQGLDRIDTFMVEHQARIQLAYGHSRLAAFQLLAGPAPTELDKAEKKAWEQRRSLFSALPVELVAFSNEEMATAAWAENAARKDLSAWEEAMAISHMQHSFGWTQDQVAKQLGLGRSTIANKLRLFKLPEAAQEQLRSGVLSERQAAALLPLADLPAEIRERRRTIWTGSTHIESANHLIEHAAEFDGDMLRRLVERIVNDRTVKLVDKPWSTQSWDIENIRASKCSQCRLFNMKAITCVDQVCADIKARAWQELKTAAAAAAERLPVTTNDYYSEIDKLDGLDLAAVRATAEQRGCERLAVLYHPTAYGSHKAGDSTDCIIVCAHGSGKRCGCRSSLATRTDTPEVSADARKRVGRKTIKDTLAPAAEASLRVVLARPTPAVWRALLRRVGSPRGLANDAGVDAIQAAIAAALVHSATCYALEAGDANHAQRILGEILNEFGATSPWATDAAAVCAQTPNESSPGAESIADLAEAKIREVEASVQGRQTPFTNAEHERLKILISEATTLLDERDDDNEEDRVFALFERIDAVDDLREELGEAEQEATV